MSSEFWQLGKARVRVGENEVEIETLVSVPDPDASEARLHAQVIRAFWEELGGYRRGEDNRAIAEAVKVFAEAYLGHVYREKSK